MTSAIYVDTSALAKYYLREAGSAEFETLIRSGVSPRTSRLTLVEFRCLLARRVRAGMIDPQSESRILAVFLAHVSQSLWQVAPLDDGDLVDAIDLIDRLGDHPLRTLDAIHLASARRSGAPQLATGDRVMAAAAKSLGMTSLLFG